MVITNVRRTHYLEDCVIDGYKGYYSQWKIQVESPISMRVLDFCKDYCAERKATKEQFLDDLSTILKECQEEKCRKPFRIKSFYELKHNKDYTIWTYTVRNILQDFV